MKHGSTRCWTGIKSDRACRQCGFLKPMLPHSWDRIRTIARLQIASQALIQRETAVLSWNVTEITLFHTILSVNREREREREYEEETSLTEHNDHWHLTSMLLVLNKNKLYHKISFSSTRLFVSFIGSRTTSTHRHRHRCCARSAFLTSMKTSSPLYRQH